MTGTHHPGSPRVASGSFEGAGRLARDLVGWAPRRSVLAALLLLVSALTETLGIAMIIPLLHVTGIGAGDGVPGPVGETIARVAASAGLHLTLPVVLGAFVALAALRAATAWQRDLHLASIRLGFVDSLRERIYAAVAGAAWPFLVRCRQSDLRHALMSDTARAGEGALCLVQLAVTAVFASAQLTLAVLISPLISLGALAAGGALVLASRPLVRRSRTLGRQLTGSGQALRSNIGQFLGGLKLAKSASAEARHVADFATVMADMRRHQLAFTGAGALARSAFDVGAAVALAALVWLAVRSAGLTLPEVLVMAFVFVRVMPALLRLQQTAQQLAHALPAYAHLLETERTLRDAAETPDGAPGAGRTPMALRRELAVRNVSFAYDPDAGRPALEAVDLTVPAGSFVAVAGPSGAGKSTLVDVLLGLIEPGAGEVRIDGRRLAGPDLRRWRRSVAYVPQDPYLFHDTIAANLRWARPEAAEAELWEALRLAAAADFVAALPDGLDTVAGDRGARLSGGERQRIVLARALLREPSLLLLDEATGQLDATAEERVVAALRSLRGRTTVVAVAHRPALMEAADRIVVLESGRVAAVGAWREVAPRLAGPVIRSDAGASPRRGDASSERCRGMHDGESAPERA